MCVCVWVGGGGGGGGWEGGRRQEGKIPRTEEEIVDNPASITGHNKKKTLQGHS